MTDKEQRLINVLKEIAKGEGVYSMDSIIRILVFAGLILLIPVVIILLLFFVFLLWVNGEFKYCYTDEDYYS